MAKIAKKFSPPTHYSEWVYDEIEYVIEESKPNGQVWQVVAVAKWRGQEKRAMVNGQLRKDVVEQLARECARDCLDLSSFNEGPYYKDEHGKLVRNPHMP